MGEWIKCSEQMPECDTTPDSFGVQVLTWPPYEADGYSKMPVSFYGCRVTKEPNFYIYGRLHFPTHWQPLPEPPND